MRKEFYLVFLNHVFGESGSSNFWLIWTQRDCPPVEKANRCSNHESKVEQYNQLLANWNTGTEWKNGKERENRQKTCVCACTCVHFPKWIKLLFDPLSRFLKSFLVADCFSSCWFVSSRLGFVCVSVCACVCVCVIHESIHSLKWNKAY